MAFVSYSGYKVGASHISRGAPCEDYASNYCDDNYAIAVISDGHGDKNCFRSATGARLACEAAIDNVRRMLKDFAPVYIELKRSPDRIITELEKCIIRTWRLNVAADIEENPFTEAEYASLETEVANLIQSGQRTHKVYGCTLIMCVFFREFWFGIHIGDGKCVTILNNGIYNQPIPWDNIGCIGNHSTSICNTRSYDSFRYVYGTEVPVAGFVASDGVDESFDDDGLYKCYFAVASWKKASSPEEFETNMDALLSKITQSGSGDDVSISFVIDMDKDLRRPVISSEQISEKMQELYSEIISTENHYESIKMEYDKSSETEVDIRRQVESLNARLEGVHNDITCMENELVRDSKRLKVLYDSFEKAKSIKTSVDNYWSSLGVAVADNSEVMNYQPRFIKTELDNEPIQPLKSKSTTETSVPAPKAVVEEGVFVGASIPKPKNGKPKLDSASVADKYTEEPIDPSILLGNDDKKEDVNG